MCWFIRCQTFLKFVFVLVSILFIATRPIADTGSACKVLIRRDAVQKKVADVFEAQITRISLIHIHKLFSATTTYYLCSADSRQQSGFFTETVSAGNST